MTVKRRTFSRDFKLQVVREVAAGKSQAEVAREHQLNLHMLTRWCREHRKYKDRAFPGNGSTGPNPEAHIGNLERMGKRARLFRKSLWKCPAMAIAQ